MTTEPQFDRQALEVMNEKAIRNEFFTPDHLYLDLGLLKDFTLGAIYSDLLKNNDRDHFQIMQTQILTMIPQYQKRLYDTVDPYFTELGYNDDRIDEILADKSRHDFIFLVSPATSFLDLLIRHIARNQNHSRPAHKYTKKKIDDKHYVVEATSVTCYINTYPLSLSASLLKTMGEELGESLGVNVKFLSKNPSLFNKSDWQEWWKNIDCYYLNSFGAFTRGDYCIEKQSHMELMGRYIFARKQLERSVIPDMVGIDVKHQIQLITARWDLLCDFAWLQNNDVRLMGEKENVTDHEGESS